MTRIQRLMPILPQAISRMLMGAFALLLVVTSPGYAQDHKSLGEFGDWQAYTYQQGGGERCTMASKPLKDEGDYSKRGPIWAFVMHRPKEGATGEVGFQMGYPIKEGSLVKLEIGGAKFDLYTSGEGAYAWREDEPRIVQTMRAGATMTVTGTSTRGTVTKDIYSLTGFTAANETINKACGVP
jgi:hypothetical protein